MPSPPFTIFGLVRTAGTARSLQEGTVGARLILTSDGRLPPPPCDLAVVEWDPAAADPMAVLRSLRRGIGRTTMAVAAGPKPADLRRSLRRLGIALVLPKPLTPEMVRDLCAGIHGETT